MPSKTTDPEIVHSKHCQDVMVDGHRFSINIFSTNQDPQWHLEIVDEESTSHVWEATFDTGKVALEAAVTAFNDEGAAGFQPPETNVVPFSPLKPGKGADVS